MNGTELTERIKDYWNNNIHDVDLSEHELGTNEFFEDLKEYHFGKLDYLLPILHSPRYRDKDVIELGCSLGTDLVEFARTGARVTGVDLSEKSVELAKQNFSQKGLDGEFKVMNAEELEYEDESFDLVYAHGLLQYTAHPDRAVEEAYRVLRPGGEAIFTVYNKYSWLNLMSVALKVDLEHTGAPVMRKYTSGQIKKMLERFSSIEINYERFPVKTKLHKGLKAFVYNTAFVGAFNMIPRPLVRPFGWHIVATAVK